MPDTRSHVVDPDVAAYVVAHSSPPDDVQRRLMDVTQERTGRAAGMQIGNDQGTLLEMLARASGARIAVEIGTFTGYSALSIARGIGPSGRLICCDVSEEWTAIAREHWELAGVADRIDLRLGRATETLADLPDDLTVEFAFIDADKVGYLAYYEALLPADGARGADPRRQHAVVAPGARRRRRRRRHRRLACVQRRRGRRPAGARRDPADGRRRDGDPARRVTRPALVA